jgi:hypothetical protein
MDINNLQSYLGRTSQDLVGGGFCFETAPFAVHPLDEVRALAYLVALKTERHDWSFAEKQIRAYLQDKGMISKQINIEVANAKSLLEPWL